METENLESLVRLGEEPADGPVSSHSFHLAPGLREAELSDQVRWTTRAGLILLGPPPEVESGSKGPSYTISQPFHFTGGETEA